MSSEPRLLLLLLLAIATGFAQEAAPGRAGVDYDTFRVSRLICTIGNNAAASPHREGYNGIFSLTTPDSNESAFVPAYAGLNLEHYFDARHARGDRKILFEPRVAPIQFRRISATKAELHQPETPVFGVESRTVFELKEPFYIDVTFDAKLHRGGFEGGFLGVFWASYINGPHDKSLYFLNANSTVAAPQWVQFATQVHGRDSTVRPAGDQLELPMGEDPRSLFRNFSPLRYGEPFFYGHIRDMVLIYLFRPSPFLRFAHSPSGGSRTAQGDDTNPAWDFQLVMPEAKAIEGIHLEMRIVYKPWAGRDDVLREVRAWQQRAASP